ncbi:putative transmembrane protein [Coxiella-like endosymbiont]|uniref:hypothetical protein n=2 Tax=Coxiellaceae TaxID=118968 RepID=UPI000CBCD292|nr:hypothetical protein [Coxiella-like endosymbiont]PMB54525.1 putative transmembrane protein [Coxiella-like endosymbiont]
MDQINKFLKFWFTGAVKTILLLENHTNVCCRASLEVDQKISEWLTLNFTKVIKGQDVKLKKILLIFSQFSRHRYLNSPKAFVQNDHFGIWINGLQDREERQTSLIQEGFYYFPVLHTLCEKLAGDDDLCA